MATVRLDNLIKPRQVYDPAISASSEVDSLKATFTDLKLDIELSKKVGLGLSPRLAKDIVVSEDVQAIRNSLYNIFSTKKGQKLLSPNFGSSLEQFLFESVTSSVGEMIGNSILNALQNYEPRIDVLAVNVYPQQDLNQYRIQVIFNFLNFKKQSALDIFLEKGGQITI